MRLQDLYARPDAAAILERMGYLARPDDAGGNSLFERDSLNRVHDTSGIEEALQAFDRRNAAGQLVYGTAGPQQYAGNRFFGGEGIDVNGGRFSQFDAGYNDIMGVPQYADFARQAGLTAGDFSYNDQYGMLLANNDRTASFQNQLRDYITQQNEGGIVDRIAGMGPILLGGAATGAALGGAFGAGAAGVEGAGGGAGALNLADAGAAATGGVISDAAPAAAGAFGAEAAPLFELPPVFSVAAPLAETGIGAGEAAALTAGGGLAAGAGLAGGGGSGAPLDNPEGLTELPTTTVTDTRLPPEAATTGMDIEKALSITGLGGGAALALSGGGGTPDIAAASVAEELPPGAGTFESGNFAPADVGLDTPTGAFDSGIFTPADVGLGSTPDANISFPGGGGGGPFNGGDASSSVDSGAFYEEATGVSDPFKAEPVGMQAWLDKALKIGPLALGGLSALQSRSANEKFAQQLAQLGGPQRAIGQQLLNDFQSGKLNAADAARISQWEQSALAQARQYFARAGTRSSTSANSTMRSISEKAEQMRQQALNGMLTTGLNTLNITDRYQQAAIQAEMQADNATRQQALQFLSAYGNWLRVLPTITGGA